MQFGEFIITCIITFSQILNPVRRNGMKIKIKVQRGIGKKLPFIILNYLKRYGVMVSEYDCQLKGRKFEIRENQLCFLVYFG